MALDTGIHAGMTVLAGFLANQDFGCYAEETVERIVL